MQPRIQFRRPHLVGTVDVDDIDEPQLPAVHRHFRNVGVGGRNHRWARQVMLDHIPGGDVGQHRHGQAALAVLIGRDDRGGRRSAFMDYVEDQFERRADDDGAAENGVRRAHRLALEPARHGHDGLRDHLGAFHHLPPVVAGDSSVGGEPIDPLGAHLEKFEQAID